MQPPLWPQLLLQVVLIALNAFFAAAEIAVLSLNEAAVRRQAEEGDRVAARLVRIAQAPTRFLSTIQIGITLAGFLAPPLRRTTLPAGLLRGRPGGMSLQPRQNPLCILFP